ncbi:MAG: lamin tail domain-containing protein, partial [Planctomycetes bacterium]|nr:lamin tail domain-containing protein [Planctomycetota bacterium]
MGDRVWRLVSVAVLAGILSPGSARGLVLTEIMYNPPGTDEALEFVEIYNEKPTPEDLSGFRFTRGIHYQFPADIGLDGLPVSVLGARQYLVLAADRDAFFAKYGFEPFGVYTGNLSNAGERIVLENDAGDPEIPGAEGDLGRLEGGRVISLNYNDRGAWYSEADGTGHSLCLIDPYADPKDPRNWAPSPILWGSPGQPNGFTDQWIDTVLIQEGTQWRYRKGTSEPPASWPNSAYDDAGWSVGTLPLGYGEGGLATTLSDMQGSYTSVHLRRRFSVADPAKIESLILSVNYDDGFVAYLNGTEVARANISGTRPAYNATADSAIEPGGLSPYDITSYKALLVAGENVLAIQIHNASLSDSSDLFIDTRLASRRVIHAGRDGRVLAINEALYTGLGERWVEIHNTSDEAIDLSNYYLSTSADILDAHALTGTIAARGFRAFREAPTLPLDLQFEGPDDTGTLRVFLTYIDAEDPSATQVVSAKAFDGDVEEGSSTARIPDGSDDWYEVTSPTEGAANLAAPGDIVTSIIINEIMYHPIFEDDAFSKDDDGLYGEELEYLELYNRGAAPVDLLGFRFTKGIDFTFTQSTVIPAGGYLVVAKNPARIEEVYGISGVQGPYAGVLADEGERVRLKDRRGNTVDEVEYGDGGHWDRWADGRGSSLELIDPRQDNASPTAWKASDDSGKSSWFRVSYSGIHNEFGRGGDSELHLYLLGKGEILIDDLKLSANSSLSPNLIQGGDFANASTYSYWIKSDDTGGTHIDSHWTGEDGHAGIGCLKVVASGRGDTGFNRLEQQATQTLNWTVTRSQRVFD